MENVPNRVTEAVLAAIHSPAAFMLVSQLLLLVVGMFMDVISATLILGPVFLPMLSAFDVDFMHFGTLMTVNLAIGYCTPPVGVSLYITGSIANKDIIYVSRAVLPFLLIQLAVLFIVAYWPEGNLWLPRAMGYIK
jgi:C4-dicarboxylate transporter DctM subunit